MMIKIICNIRCLFWILVAATIIPKGLAHGDSGILEELRALGALNSGELLQQIRKSKICVLILDSKRQVPYGTFTWGEIEKPRGMLSEVSAQKNLMGKTFCKGERPISKECTTIVLASDAPRSTLLHEWLHVKQIDRASLVSALFIFWAIVTGRCTRM